MQHNIKKKAHLLVDNYNKKNYKLEGWIDDERQFKTAKCSQAPGDATVLKRFFHDNFVTFRRRLKIAF